MKCPFCDSIEDKVLESREIDDGESIRRRRECLSCRGRFTSYERIEERPVLVIKRDGRREQFSRQKVLTGILRACEKRPVSLETMEAIVDEEHSFTYKGTKYYFCSTEDLEKFKKDPDKYAGQTHQH